MDYNNIDEDDVESLRLAALMSCKRKPTNLINTISSTSGDKGQNKFINNSSYNNYGNRNTRGRFTQSNRSFNKRTYTNVGFRRPTHSNNNLISIIPIDTEGDQLSENSKSQVNKESSSTFSLSTNSDNKITNEKNEVSTKFSRLDNDSGSEESSDDSNVDKEEKLDSDDGDVLLLGQEDEDLDDLDKLMDIMEAEIAGKEVKPKKEKRSIKQCNKGKKDNKLSESKIKAVTIKCESQPVIGDDLKILPKQAEELESIKTVEEVRNSSSFSGLTKLNIHPRSPSPIRRRSISPYRQLRKRSLTPRSPRRRSPTPDRYRYSPVRSRTFRRSLTPRRSPRRMSPLREKNLSPRRYTPPKSRYAYRSLSPRRRRRSISRDISPGRRRLSPLRRRSRSPLRSKSRSPKCRIPIRRRSPSPLKKVRCVSPLLRRKDTKMDDNSITIKEKPKSIDKEIDDKILDPVLEARKRKFESNKPIEPSSKKIILKKSNSVQVAIQTDNKEEIETDVSNKISLSAKKTKLSPHVNQSLKNCIKTKNKCKPVDKIVKMITQSEKNNRKRPRIMFGKEDVTDQHIEEKDILELSSTSEEIMDEEKEEEAVSEESEYNEDSEKEEGQESSESIEDDSEEENDNQDIHHFSEDKKDSLKCDETVDLRTELKRRRALRLNSVQVKKKSGNFYPARLLQSAIRGVVGSGSSIDVKRKVHGEIPEISIKTEGNSDGRRVVVVNRDKNRSEVDVSLLEKDFEDEEEESYKSVKQLKGKLKKVPSRLRTIGVTENLTIHKGLRKMKKRNISVTDFNQM